MATRFYLPRILTAPATVTPHALWDQADAVTVRGTSVTPQNTSAGSAAIVNRTTTPPTDVLMAQYVSLETLPQAKTISGTFSAAVLARGATAAARQSLQITIRVVSGDGTTVRGTLYGGYLGTDATPSGIFSTATVSRMYPVTALTPVAAQAGDRIVFELGYHSDSAASATDTGGATFRLGDALADVDATAANQGTAGFKGWLEFSDNLLTVSPNGPIAATAPKFSASLAGTSTPPARSGTVAATAPKFSAAITGTARPPGVSGDLTGTAPAFRSTSSGTSTPPPRSGTLSATAPRFTATGTGTSNPPSRSGALAATAPAFSAAITATVKEPTTGDLSVMMPAFSAQVAGVLAGAKPSRPGNARWTLSDPARDETWTFPINPNRMTSPHSPRNFNILATAPTVVIAGHARGGLGRVIERNAEPYEWSISGVIREEDHYQELLRWSRKLNKLVLTDHFGRKWSIRILHFNPDEKKPTARRNWRYAYDLKTLNYGAIT